MTQVTKEEFFRVIGPLNVHPTPEGNYPYVSVFRDVNTRVEMGRIKNGATNQESQYFLVNPPKLFKVKKQFEVTEDNGEKADGSQEEADVAAERWRAIRG